MSLIDYQFAELTIKQKLDFN